MSLPDLDEALADLASTPTQMLLVNSPPDPGQPGSLGSNFRLALRAPRLILCRFPGIEEASSALGGHQLPGQADLRNGATRRDR